MNKRLNFVEVKEYKIVSTMEHFKKSIDKKYNKKERV